ncbi:MAG: inositol monophosphatase family protein [Actinomycetota bacterium]|nr:inositol monophosphatase family protein [Actinomycetota bacterium]
MQDELRAAREAARSGAEAIIARRGNVGLVRLKSTLTDVVTDADIAAGVAVALSLLAHDPGARFVIEESEVYELAGVVEGSLSEGDTWVVDPLDGTTSFVHGYPTYSVSVALLREGRPVVGATYNVPTGELVSGAVGHGAWRDEERVKCTGVSGLAEALLITGFPYDRGALLDRQLDCLGSFLRSPVHGIRRDGSAAVDCCHVACGRADGFWEFGLKPWDMAAGVVILGEAGARVTGIGGEEWTPASTGIIAANLALHELMCAVILPEDRS